MPQRCLPHSLHAFFFQYSSPPLISHPSCFHSFPLHFISVPCFLISSTFLSFSRWVRAELRPCTAFHLGSSDIGVHWYSTKRPSDAYWQSSQKSKQIGRSLWRQFSPTEKKKASIVDGKKRNMQSTSFYLFPQKCCVCVVSMVTVVCHGDLSTPREQCISIQAMWEAEQLVPQPPQPAPNANVRETLVL